MVGHTIVCPLCPQARACVRERVDGLPQVGEFAPTRRISGRPAGSRKVRVTDDTDGGPPEHDAGCEAGRARAPPSLPLDARATAKARAAAKPRRASRGQRTQRPLRAHSRGGGAEAAAAPRRRSRRRSCAPSRRRAARSRARSRQCERGRRGAAAASRVRAAKAPALHALPRRRARRTRRPDRRGAPSSTPRRATCAPRRARRASSATTSAASRCPRRGRSSRSRRAASRSDWSKLLESAVANAEHNHELIGDELRVKAVYADVGPTLKRFRPRAQGRATPIHKRTSHLSIALTPKE